MPRVRALPKSHDERMRSLQNSLPDAQGASQEEQDRAGMQVAGHARAWDDCLSLLDALGLAPDRLLGLAQRQRAPGRWGSQASASE